MPAQMPFIHSTHERKMLASIEAAIRPHLESSIRVALQDQFRMNLSEFMMGRPGFHDDEIFEGLDPKQDGAREQAVSRADEFLEEEAAAMAEERAEVMARRMLEDAMTDCDSARMRCGPSEITSESMAPLGVKVVNNGLSKLRCIKCGTTWEHEDCENSVLPCGWWQCPKGCNVHGCACQKGLGDLRPRSAVYPLSLI